MDLFRYMQENAQKYNSRNRDIQRKNQENLSYNSLKAQIDKRMTTAIIGTLDAAEKRFGHLWGKNKAVTACTEQELEFRELWATLRKDILDHGNNQKRILLDDLSQYTVRWDKNLKTFPIHERKI